MVKIDFLNVGHGDCSIISHGSARISMIDINNGTEIDKESAKELLDEYKIGEAAQLYALYKGVSESCLLKEAGYTIELINPIEFLMNHYQGKSIFRYIQTHPDLDHMRGLVGLSKEKVDICNFWDTEHDKVPEFQSDSDKEEWQEYEKYRSGNKNIKILNIYQGCKAVFYAEDPQGVPPGDGWEILSPTPEIARAAVEAENWNNLSYVLRLTYKGIKIIFAGDAEKEVWDDLVKVYGDDLKCNVLKASHHGRDTGYHEEAMKRMNPQYTIVSVGKKPENDASNKYRKYCDNVWSTRWKGNITLEIFEDGRGQIVSQYER